MKHLISAVVLFVSGLVSAQDSSEIGTLNGRKIRHYERTMRITGNPDSVFAFMDDIRNTGKHMTESSGAMAGSKLQIEWLSENKTGPGTKYRWTGKVVGMKMDFTVKVSEWAGGKKVWGTVGEAKMIVIDWFEMYLITTPAPAGDTDAKLGIYYTKHKGLWGFLLGKWYAKWCVKTMLKDTRKHFKK
jgi:hypothetical protein